MVQIESSDIIKLIFQFFKENNLNESLKALEKETKVKLNSLDYTTSKQLSNSILEGNFSQTLKILKSLNLPQENLISLFDLIFCELLLEKEFLPAKNFFLNAQVFEKMRLIDPNRYLVLNQFLTERNEFDEKLAFKNVGKIKLRKIVEKEISSKLTVVDQNRLLTLLNQSLKFQEINSVFDQDTATESYFDLFQGIKVDGTSANKFLVEKIDRIPKTPLNKIKFPKSSFCESGIFFGSKNFVTGTADGFIEIWDFATGKQDMTFPFQKEENIMMMDDSVLTLNLSKDSTLLASGSSKGVVTVWRINSGIIFKTFKTAHQQGVTSLCFNHDGTSLISSSFDLTIKLHGLKSGKTLKEFRGHTSFVNTCFFSHCKTKIVSGSSDGTVKIWDLKSNVCIKTLTIHEGNLSNTISPTVFKLIIKFYELKKAGNLNFVQFSPKKSILYFFCDPKEEENKRKTGEEDVKNGFGRSEVGEVGKDGEIYLNTFEFETEYYDLIPVNHGGTTGNVVGFSASDRGNYLGIFFDNGNLNFFKD
ncbi:Serine/threonine-protein kinase smu1 [Lobulomyces angularis]|nr:Serine/threonine-protein kinase smu1 [Lobulomyces angularis]